MHEGEESSWKIEEKMESPGESGPRRACLEQELKKDSYPETHLVEHLPHRQGGQRKTY